MEVSVFFTFWGLFALVKPGVRITGDNWMQKMLSVMNPGNPAKAKLVRLHFAGAGPGMMKKLAKDYKTPLPTELLEMAQDMGVRLIPCQMTMDLLGLKRDDLDRRAGGADRRRDRAARDEGTPPSSCSSRRDTLRAWPSARTRRRATACRSARPRASG